MCTFTWQGRASRLAQLARPQNDGRGSRDETARHTLHTVIQNAPNVDITYCVKHVDCHIDTHLYSHRRIGYDYGSCLFGVTPAAPRLQTAAVTHDHRCVRSHGHPMFRGQPANPWHIAMHIASAQPSHAHRYYTYTDDVEWQPCTSIEMHDPPARHPSTPVPHASPRGEQRHPPSRLTARAQDSLSPGQREPRTLAPCSAISHGRLWCARHPTRMLISSATTSSS